MARRAGARLREAALVGAALLLAASDIPEGVEPWQPWAFVAAAVAAVAILGRGAERPWGVVTALAALVVVGVGAAVAGEPGQVPFGHVLVVAGLLAHAAWWRPLRVVAAMAVAAVVTAIVIEGLADGRGVADASFTALVWLAAMSAALAARWRRQAVAATAERTRSEERERIARDLHDVVAHHVSAIAMIAEGGRVAGDPEVADRSLAAIHDAAVTALDEMRAVVAVLRDDGSGAARRLAELADLAADVESPVGTGPSVAVALPPDLDSLGEPPHPVVVAVHRIVTEAVTNARRHARGATQIDVAVAMDRSRLVATIDDDGHDSGAPHTGGHGLAGMAERARLLGGTLAAGPRDGGGWRVRVELPLAGGQDQPSRAASRFGRQVPTGGAQP